MSTATTFRYHAEIIDGKEIEKPLPKRLHALITARIMQLLFESGQLKELNILPELNLLIGNGDRIVPDLTLARREAEYINGDLPAGEALLCIEILSPGQSLWSLFDKCERLLKAGAPLCWVIWGEKRRMWQYTLDSPLETRTLMVPVLNLPIDDVTLFHGINTEQS